MEAAMLSLFDDDNPPTLPPHLQFLFSSPTTDTDDNNSIQHSPSATNEVVAHIDSLLQQPCSPSPPPIPPLPPFTPVLHHSQHPHLQPKHQHKLEQHLHPVTPVSHHPHPHPHPQYQYQYQYQHHPSVQQPQPQPQPPPSSRSTTPPHSKKRPLSVMQALAKKNAPTASLTNDDLLKIGAMSESDLSLAQSKHVYNALTTFKDVLVTFGYRINALYLDTVPDDHPPTQHHPPFAFVLNHKPHAPSTPVNSQQTGTSPPVDHTPDMSNNSSSDSSTFPSTHQHLHPLTTSSSTQPCQPSAKRIRLSAKQQSPSAYANKYSCTVCHKKMADATNLVRHFRHTHQQLKPFQCPKCGGHYSSEGTLWHHIANVHTDCKRTHKCEFCDASYDSCGAKTRHVHGTHHMETPLYPCPFKQCMRTFVFPAHLEQHAQDEHDGFRPFQCEECSKSFSSSNGLVRHCREVHRREKAYTCPLCRTGLTKRCHLKRHLLNVHHMEIGAVDEEMKKHPNPADIPPVVTQGNRYTNML